MTIIEFFKNPLVLFALGCLVSYVVYVRQARFRRLSYQRWDTFVIDPKIGQDDSLEVRFAGNTVPRVTRTVIRFWNSGTETIYAHDLSAIDPLRWQLPDGSAYLSVSIEKTTRAANAVTTTQDGNRLAIGFDFLDRADGATLSVLHTANARKVKVHGIIKGGRLSDVGSTTDIPPAMLLSEERKPKRVNRWPARILVFAIYAFFFSFLTITLSGLFPDYFLDNFPGLFSDAPQAPKLVRGQVNLGRSLFGFGISLVLGTIAFLVFRDWKNRPPEKLRLDK